MAAARLLAAEGAEVVVNGRTEARVDEALRTIRNTVEGARVEGFTADLGSAAGCQTLINPDLDILIVYVCSGRAVATNGAALRVDGGVVRSVI